MFGTPCQGLVSTDPGEAHNVRTALAKMCNPHKFRLHHIWTSGRHERARAPVYVTLVYLTNVHVCHWGAGADEWLRQPALCLTALAITDAHRLLRPNRAC